MALVLFLHLLGASIWVGGHLILAIRFVAAHARFRVIPKLYRQPQGAGVRFFCLHVLMVTLLAVSFVYLGVAFRFGAVFGGV